MKYPEFILAIQNRYLQSLNWQELVWQDGSPKSVTQTLQEGFNRVDLDVFMHSVQGGLTIAQREDLDESKHWGESHKGNRDFRQWLNYVVIEGDDGLIHPYMRSRVGAATGETDLHGRGSIAPGGHTDANCIKICDNSIIHQEPTFLKNILAELCEECAFYIDGERIVTHRYEKVGVQWERRELIANLSTLSLFGSLHFEGVMFDNSDAVGRLHLAVSWRFKLRSNVTIGQNEAGVDFVEPVNVKDLFVKYPNVLFENWSMIFAEHLRENDTPAGVDVLRRALDRDF